MHNSLCKIIQITLVISLIVFGGCATVQKPSRFYVLSPLNNQEGTTSENSPRRDIVLGIGPVELPQYLDRPNIVLRTSQNELKVSEFELWAEPLEDNFSRILAENLSNLNLTDHIIFFPWKRKINIDFQIAVDVTQFDCQLKGDYILNVRWTIFGRNGKKLLTMNKSSFSKKAFLDDYVSLVKLLNENLSDLSREISLAIRSRE